MQDPRGQSEPEKAAEKREFVLEPFTRMKINPETYMVFDGSDMVMLQNIRGDGGIRIKFDIMLILYELVDWKTVDELLAPWPLEDQAKIVEHLEMLYNSKVIVCHEDEVKESSESGISEKLGRNVHINLNNHHNMLKDYVRTAAFRRAIERAVTPETIAMDLGCGTGILGFFAAKAGAKSVFAVEKRPDVIQVAEDLAKKNGLEQVKFIAGNSSQLKETEFDPKPNLLISEILGNGILNENILEFMLDARDRFLAPGGRMIPNRLDIYSFAFHSAAEIDVRPEVAELNDLYGLDFSLMSEMMHRHVIPSYERYRPEAYTDLSEPHCVKSLDLMTLDTTFFTQRFQLTMTKDGTVSGICSYFKAFLDEETTLTNSPWAPKTHWTQLVHVLCVPRHFKAGQTVTVEMIYDGMLRVRLVDDDTEEA